MDENKPFHLRVWLTNLQTGQTVDLHLPTDEKTMNAAMAHLGIDPLVGNAEFIISGYVTNQKGLNINQFDDVNMVNYAAAFIQNHVDDKEKLSAALQGLDAFNVSEALTSADSLDTIEFIPLARGSEADQYAD